MSTVDHVGKCEEAPRRKGPLGPSFSSVECNWYCCLAVSLSGEYTISIKALGCLEVEVDDDDSLLLLLLLLLFPFFLSFEDDLFFDEVEEELLLLLLATPLLVLLLSNVLPSLYEEDEEVAAAAAMSTGDLTLHRSTL